MAEKKYRVVSGKWWETNAGVRTCYGLGEVVSLMPAVAARHPGKFVPADSPPPPASESKEAEAPKPSTSSRSPRAAASADE